MTLSSDISTTSSSFNDIKTAIINKGVSVSGSITNYPSAIMNIPTPPPVINREISQNGVYQMPATSFTFSLPSDATDLGQRALYYAFYGCTGLTSVDLSSLITVSGADALYYAFSNCTNLTSVDLSSLTTVRGGYSVFGSYAFQYCTSLTSVDLSSLTSINGSSALGYAFSGCTSLSSLFFPSLSSFGSYTNQFYYMLQGVTGCTVHFPSNLQSVIGSWSDVQNGFGGTSTTVLFDLPATT